MSKEREIYHDQSTCCLGHEALGYENLSLLKVLAVAKLPNLQ